MQYGKQIDRLERELKNLTIEYEKFFNGANQVPPEEMRSSLKNELKRLRSVFQLTSVERFRLGSLEARFNSFSDMFQRRLRQRETGQGAPRRAPRPAGRQPTGGKAVVVGDRVDSTAVESLYQELARANRTPDLASFRTYLTNQVARIRDRTGCNQVQLRVVSEGGKVKLKAKPLRSTA